VIFEGEIDAEEERDALREAGGLPGLRKDSRVLVDRRRARTRAHAADVAPQMELADQAFPTTARPRMAVVAPADHDFGMLRMLQMTGDDKLPHELGVFRTLEEACAFVDVDPASLADVLER